MLQLCLVSLRLLMRLLRQPHYTTGMYAHLDTTTTKGTVGGQRPMTKYNCISATLWSLLCPLPCFSLFPSLLIPVLRLAGAWQGLASSGRRLR